MKRVIRKKFKKFWKSVINRRLVKYASRFSVVVFLLAAVLSFGKIQGTNSFFTDTATVEGNEFSAGYWVPELSMSVEKSAADGNDNWYVTRPCVTLTASVVSDVKIYFEFSNDGDPVAGGTLYGTACVPIPESATSVHFQAIVVNKANSDWKSNLVSGEFKVDTVNPVADINTPSNGDTISGTVEIKATVTDANPKSYQLKIKDHLGATVWDSGAVNMSSSFTNDTKKSWDTTVVADGDYTFELSAVDQAGNQSVTKTTSVAVANTPVVSHGAVIINEVMWMGSQEDPAHTYYGKNDQWVELKNVSGKTLHLKDWYLTYKKNSGSEVKLAEIGNNREVKDGEYFLISRYNKSNSAININGERDEVFDMSDSGAFEYEKFQIKLYTSSAKTTLVDTAGSGDKEPTEGDKTNFYSMERKNTPGIGLDYSNWYTCKDASSTTLYWDSGRTERGTPGNINLSKNDPTAPDYDPDFVEPVEKANPTIIPESNLLSPEIPGAKMPTTLNIQTDTATIPETASNETPPESVVPDESEIKNIEEPKIVTKEFDINLTGKLTVPEGFLAETDQKMKKIELSGEEKVINDLKDFEIDLTKVKIDKAGKIEILVSDLNFPKDVDLTDAKKDDVVVLVTVTEKPKDETKEEPKKEEVKKVDATVPKADDSKADEKKDDSGGSGNGDPNNQNKAVI